MVKTGGRGMRIGLALPLGALGVLLALAGAMAVNTWHSPSRQVVPAAVTGEADAIDLPAGELLLASTELHAASLRADETAWVLVPRA